MGEAGLWRRARRHQPYRQRRERKAHFGELVQLDELENLVERAVIVTRARSLDAPLEELRKANTIELPHAHDRKLQKAVEERKDSQSDQTTVAEEYERKQRDEVIRALTACKGRVGGTDGAAARMGMNRTTFLSRMKKFGIYAKQYA